MTLRSEFRDVSMSYYVWFRSSNAICKMFIVIRHCMNIVTYDNSDVCLML
jgi:hypothetical protein